MASLNRCEFIGNLGSDPDTRYMPNGDAVSTFNIACNERWKDKASGEDKEKTEWVRIVLFRRNAEIAAEYLRKGAQIFVEGRLQTRKWTDKEGVDRYTSEVVAHRFLMLGRKDGNRPPHPADQEGAEAQPASSGGDAQSAGQTADFDDDIPF